MTELTLDDLDLGGQVKIAVYGRAGTGKTRLVGTLPGRVRLISAESGLLSLNALPREVKRRISVVQITTFDQAAAEYARLKTAHTDYDWIAIDSISELADLFLREMLATAKDPRQAYGEMSRRVGDLFRNLRDLPCNVYMAAKEEQTKDDATGKISYGPSFPGGQLPRDVPHLYDELFRLAITREGDRVLITSSDTQSYAKDRSGLLDQYEPADLGEIARKIAGEATDTGDGASE